MSAAKRLWWLLVLAASAASSSALVGCDQKSPAEDNTGSDDKGGSGEAAGKGNAGGAGKGGGGAGGGAGSSSSSAVGGASAGSTGTAGQGEGGNGQAGKTGGGVGGSKATGGGSGKGGGKADAGPETGGKDGAGGGLTGAGGNAAPKDSGAGTDGAAASDGSTGKGGGSCIEVSSFTGWAGGKGPLDIGALAVKEMKTHVNDTYDGAGYSLAIAWYGALEFTVTTNDTTTNASLISSFDAWTDAKKAPANSSDVDKRVFGVLPLEIYIETKKDSYKTQGMAYADAQWDGNAGSDGITKDARYWIDDMYMITGLQVMAYRATKDSKYLDRAAKTLLSYASALQQSDGLFWHTKQSKAYWGRANGWVASGMTELLKELPSGSTRDSVAAAYQKQIDALLKVQMSGGADDGCWRQVLDVSTASAETSCTAMFTYALVAGTRNGWLTDPKYSEAAKKGWGCLANKTDTNGVLDKVCPGTGQADAGDLASQQKFYLDRPLGKGDLHGQAPLLWSANELITTDCHGIR